VPPTPFYRDQFRKPELLLADVVRRGAQGQFRGSDESQTVLYRAAVVAIDVIGGKLENPSGDGKLTHVLNGKSYSVPATAGPENPPNSVKARIITNGFDQFVHDDRLRVFWPLFPEHDAVPIKPGEHVYVMFEDPAFEHGLWFGKVAGNVGINYFAGQDAFRAADAGSLVNKFGDTGSASGTDDQLDTDADAAETRPDDTLKKAHGLV
jgi:hypothetical protein